MPLGAHATIENTSSKDNAIQHEVIKGKTINITGFVASVDGKQMLRETMSGNAKDADLLGKALAGKLVNKGAKKILDALDGVK